MNAQKSPSGTSHTKAKLMITTGVYPWDNSLEWVADAISLWCLEGLISSDFCDRVFEYGFKYSDVKITAVGSKHPVSITTSKAYFLKCVRHYSNGKILTKLIT